MFPWYFKFSDFLVHFVSWNFKTELVSLSHMYQQRPFPFTVKQNSPFPFSKLCWQCISNNIIFCCCSVMKLCPTLCDSMDCSTSGFPVLHHLWEFVQTHVHWVGDAIQQCHPLFLPSLPALKLSRHQGPFQWVGCLHEVAKVLELQLQHRPSNEYSGLILFWIDWFDFLADQRTLSSLLQPHSLKALILWCSALFMVQLSHPYKTTEKKQSFEYMHLCQQNDVSVF